MTQEITLAEYHALPKRGNKYGAQPTVADGVLFDSKKEAQRYLQLRQMERAGAITGLERQPRYLIQDSYRGRDGKWVRAISYVGDFAYVETATGVQVCEDVKGVRTAVFNLKWKLVQPRYPDVVFRLV